MNNMPGTNPARWEAEETHPEECKILREHLSQVLDPEIQFSVIQLGLIRNVRFEEGQVMINMILTTPFCPYGSTLIEMVRSKAEQATALPATIQLGMEVWDFSMMEEGLDLDWGLY